MKTAIQELFSQLEIEHPSLFNTNTLEGRQFINDYYKFFELEKEQIKNANIAGVNQGLYGYKNAEEYYNKTYKINKL